MKRSTAAIGSGLFFAVAPGIVAGIVPWWLNDYEEPTLRATFGQGYDDYAAQVPRWLPRVR